jgi:hypothetical protein
MSLEFMSIHVPFEYATGPQKKSVKFKLEAVPKSIEAGIKGFRMQYADGNDYNFGQQMIGVGTPQPDGAPGAFSVTVRFELRDSSNFENAYGGAVMVLIIADMP